MLDYRRVTVGNLSIHFYEGNPQQLHDILSNYKFWQGRQKCLQRFAANERMRIIIVVVVVDVVDDDDGGDDDVAVDVFVSLFLSN